MTVLVSDSFNRANGSLGSTDSYNGGTSLPWQTSTANFIISGNKGTVNALDDTQFAYVDCGQSDVIVSMDFSQTSTLGNCPKLFFRGTNFTNAYLTYWTGAGWQLYKLVNGILTNLASSTSVGGPTSTNVVNVKVECNGTTLKWYLNGTLIATITDSTFNGTKHGWGTQRVQGLADNFVIESLGTGGTPTTQDGTASLVGTGTVSTIGNTLKQGTANLIGTAFLTADGSIVSAVNVLDGSANLIGTGTLSASPVLFKNGQAILLGTGTLSANADVTHIAVTIDGTFQAVGLGVLEAFGTLVEQKKPPIIGSIILKGSLSTTVNIKGSKNTTIHLKGGIQ